MTWHLDLPTASAYARRGTDQATAASIEAHLNGCATCQALMTSVDPQIDAWLDDVWVGIDDALDGPRLSLTERVLRAAGCSETTSRIVAASSGARWSYLTAVAMSIALAIGAAWSGRDAAFGLFLLLAPIGPLVATSGAFGRWSDPLHPLLRTLPTSAWRMALTRTAASVAPAIALTSVTIPILGGRGWAAVAWLLPALALCTATLALATWIAIEPATIVVGAVWLTPPILLRIGAVDLIDVISGRGQVVAAVIAGAAAVVVSTRRTTFELQVLS